MKRLLTRDDILAVDDYARVREERLRAIERLKAHRRVEVGPYARFDFECYETLQSQLHEVLWAENGGEDVLQRELDACNRLIPQGHELVAALTFEIPDPDQRKAVLDILSGVEHFVRLSIETEVIDGVAETSVRRGSEDDRQPARRFLRLPFTDHLIHLFRQPAQEVVLGIGHPAYGHLAILPEVVRHTLAGDFAIR